MQTAHALLIVLGFACAAARADDAERVPPFVTTPPEVVERMLALAGVGPQDFVIDLGAGDGRIVIAAAAKFGARGLGVELHGELVARAQENARRAGVAGRAEFVQGDALQADLGRASVVTLYLLPGLLDRLQPALLRLAPGTRIVSHTFRWSGWPPDRSETMRLSARHEGQGDLSTVHLWIVPAQLRGEWRSNAADDAQGWRLRIAQNFQALDIEAEFAGRAAAITDARLSGREFSFRAGEAQFRGRVDGDRIAGALTRPGGSAPLELAFARIRP